VRDGALRVRPPVFPPPSSMYIMPALNCRTCGSVLAAL